MVDPGHVFRRAFSWLPAQFASQSDAPVGPRQFGSTEHLSIEAIAAFVDGELRMNAHLRAATTCRCARSARPRSTPSGQARAALRDSCPIIVPSVVAGLVVPDPAPRRRRDPPVRARIRPQFADGDPRARRKRR